MLSGPEIQANLAKFVAKWRGYGGSEKAEAQTFLNELFACYGSDRVEVGAKFEEFKSSAGFMDLFWPSHLIVEMKAPGVPLEKAEDQRVRYWQESADPDDEIPAASYVVVCNFGEFEVWEPGKFPKNARTRFRIEELADRYDSLLFLQSEASEPIFAEHRRALTTDAAKHISALYTSLADRSAASPDTIQRFIVQIVWCLFAEDLGMLADYPLQNTVDSLLKQKEPDSAREIGYLFRLLNQKGDHNRQGMYRGTKYVNGELFREPAEVLMNLEELRHLRDAAKFDWRTVDPTIFGSLLEGVLGPERRDKLGAHYTHESDILKIVIPTIVKPWRKRIEATKTPEQACDVLDELCQFKVLDPACGCGNFLYVAYRELRALESELKNRIEALSEKSGLPKPSRKLPYFPLSNIFGIDIEGIAVQIARVTLWMGHRQMIDRYGAAEPVLPLVDLSGIRTADALRTTWPEVDAIIGNPPFLGSQLLRSSLGDSYVEWLKDHFEVGIRDLCVYWFRRAQKVLRPGQRAGLVGTNSISQNRAREASLEYVVNSGGVITNAVSSQKWPGEAKVHVSIVNWVKKPQVPPTKFELDGKPVAGITSSLKPVGSNDLTPEKLALNRDRCFQGPIPVGSGFILTEQKAKELLAATDADYSKVVFQYLIGDDITKRPDQSPSRWIIDFAQMSLEQANKYPKALDIVKSDVKPFRETVRREGHQKKWWLFGEPRVGMRRALAGKDRYVAGTATGKRLFLAWATSSTCPSNLTNVFAFDDDYSMGVLLSRAHDAWAWAGSSTLETRLRYTPTSVFETFPWPDPNDEQRKAISEASVALYERRLALCREHDYGLTKLYNLMDEGAFTDLKALHLRLDQAVVSAYGWSKSIAQDSKQLVEHLAKLNQEITQGKRVYHPFQ